MTREEELEQQIYALECRYDYKLPELYYELKRELYSLPRSSDSGPVLRECKDDEK